MCIEPDYSKIFERTKLLIGGAKFNLIQNSNILLFGMGGVGSYVGEALVRAGIEKLTVVDADTVDITNVNRQLIANIKTVGQEKTEVFIKKMLAINPHIKIKGKPIFFLPHLEETIKWNKYDFIIDAIDTTTAKISIVHCALENTIPLISCMGTGNKLNPRMLKIENLFKTKMCPLAKTMRNELRKRGMRYLTVLYSEETIIKRESRTPASISFVPGTAGLLIAGEVINSIIEKVSTKHIPRGKWLNNE